MNKKINKILLLISISLLAAGLTFFCYDQLLTDKHLLKNIENEVQQEFLEIIKNIENNTLQNKLEASFNEQKIIQLTYDENGTLKNWSSSNFVPNNQITKEQLSTDENEILQDRDFVFYNVKTKLDTNTVFNLIPLKITYPIKNEYLNDFIYLGNFSNDNKVIENFSNFKLSTIKNTKNGINIFDSNNKFIFSITIYDTSSFRWEIKFIATILMAFGLGLLYTYFFKFHNTKNNNKKEIILLFSLYGLRAITLITNFPKSYIESEFFSSRLLALNDFFPSLGDLIINIFLIYITIKIASKTNYIKNISQKNQTILNILNLIILSLIHVLFYFIFENIYINSKIYLNYSDILKINLYSLTIFICLFLLLKINYFLKIKLQINPNIKINNLTTHLYNKNIIAIIITILIICTTLTLTLQYEYALTYLILSISVILISNIDIYKQNQIIKVFALCISNTIIIFVAININEHNKMIAEMNRLSQKYLNQRDIITEYVFDEVVENIKNDKSLWEIDSTFDGPKNVDEMFINQIINKHLINSFKGYDFQIFIFNIYGRRIDNQYELNPYQLTILNRTQGKTLSNNFYLVPYNRNLTKQIYVGNFQISSTLILQIELHPKSITGGKIFPKLLLDDQIRQKIQIPSGYDVGIYQNNKLITCFENQNQFDKQITFPIILKNNYINTEYKKNKEIIKNNKFWEFHEYHTNSKLIVIRHPVKSINSNISLLSILFYLNVTLYLILNIYKFLSYLSWIKIQKLNNSFIFRVQFYILLISISPMVLFWFISTSMFTKLFHQEEENKLKMYLEQVSQYIGNENSFLDELRLNSITASPSSRDLINRISNLLSCDINIYNINGRLHSTTKSRLYHTSLTSYYMSPTSYNSLVINMENELIIKENIGNLYYLSGYKPIFDSNLNIVGFLNIPFLAEQELLDYQIEKYITYLINIYIFLIFILMTISYFISKTLTYPLEILRKKMSELNFGLPNQPIKWTSNDEIGSLIKSYNTMLIKLKESEIQLAKSERETAWREMAKQVAHEIKNPLTPMKLSIQHLLRIINNNEKSIVKICNTLLSQIDSLTEIANSFSTFASMPKDKKSEIEINEILHNIYELYKNNENYDIEFEIINEKIIILGDSNQLNRVIVNIIRNSIQSLQNEGKIKINLSHKFNNAIISISDNGSGIAPEIQSKIFEPNFSTKTSGMGLGLAITKRIIESMDGNIYFVSQPGVGTTFFIELPILHVK